jgi:predicted ribosome quality control (RQC) complex YloA/Tae2 family protein
MELKINIDKSIEENASIYFDNAKKLKKKIEGTKKALILFQEKLNSSDQEEIIIKTKKIVQEKREWFEKFRWFYSSEGFLCIGGRDATSNEIIIKKHTEKNDIVFHTDMSGSPFFVVKVPKDKQPTIATLNETAQAVASFSRAWKSGLAVLEVFYVNPDQVSKEANPGEYMAKGSFMVRGKTNYLRPELKVAIGLKEDKIMCGAIDAIEKHCEKYFILVPGQKKPSDIAKKLSKEFSIQTDEIIRAIPAGNLEIIKNN